MTAEKTIYLPGLNGIRAIAALGVMISHINMDLFRFDVKSFSLFGFNEPNHQRGWILGEQGVTMFFVLSGFLITYLLLLEKQKTNHISKINFYIRRILRIWPLYYFYFILSILVYYLFSSKAPGSISLFYIFLLANIPFVISKAIPLCAHLWSIAVEEQFYLFWPHLFGKKAKMEMVFTFVIVLSILARILLWRFYPGAFITVLFTVNRFDCMIFGGLIAFYHFNNNRIVLLLNHKIMQIFAWFIVFLHILNYEIVNSIITMELMTLATGIIIIGQVNKTNRTISLETKALNFLGKYSYGIYVYHPLIIFLFSKLFVFPDIGNEVVKSGILFCTIAATTIIVAYLSYEFFEKRFIRLKDKFSIIHSTNNPN